MRINLKPKNACMIVQMFIEILFYKVNLMINMFNLAISFFFYCVVSFDQLENRYEFYNI